MQQGIRDIGLVAIEKFARRIYLIDEKQVKILLLQILCTESGVSDEDQQEADMQFFLTRNVVKRIEHRTRKQEHAFLLYS